MSKNKKPKRIKKIEHPTLFVLEGSIKVYEEGSMLDLHTQITTDEWTTIVEETIKYKCFVECLKETAIPLLEETWEKDDDWFRIQLDIAVSRMRNIDALLVASHNTEEIKKIYTEAMKKNGKEMLNYIKEVRQQMNQLVESQRTTDVSDI